MTWDFHPPSTRVWATAVAYSFFAMLLAVGVEACRSLPVEWQRWSRGRAIKIVHCRAVPDSHELLALVADCDLREIEPGYRHSLHRIGLRTRRCEAAVPLGFQAGNCFAVQSGPERVFLLPDTGGIAQLDLLQPTHLSARKDFSNARVHSVAVSADGRKLLVHTVDQLTCWSFPQASDDSFKIDWQIRQPHIECFALRPGADVGAFCCFVDDHNIVYEFEVDSGSARQVAEVAGPRCRNMCFSATHTYVALIKDEGLTQVLGGDHEGNWLAHDTPGLASGTAHIGCFAPSGDLLVVSDWDNQQLAVWDVKQRRRVTLTKRLPWPLLGACWIDEHRYVAWGLSDKLSLFDFRSTKPIGVVACTP